MSDVYWSITIVDHHPLSEDSPLGIMEYIQKALDDEYDEGGWTVVSAVKIAQKDPDD
jgi:hypothetical protein